MCTPFAHGLAGYAVLVLAEPALATDLRSNVKAAAAGFFFGALADADFLPAYFSNIPALQHHYFTHSIPFTALIGLLTYLFLRFLIHRPAPWRLTMILTACYATHLVLDYFTQDGSAPIGIPLLWPFSNKHFVAPVELFLSIHRGSIDTMFGSHNFKALFREVLILGPFAFGAYWKGRHSGPQASS